MADGNPAARRQTAFIRPVEPRDKAAVARLWQMLTDHHVALDPRLPGAADGAAERYAARLIERRSDPATMALVAEVAGEVVGYVLGAVIDLHPDLFQPVDAGFIADIFVDPAYRGRGLARELVATLNDWFRGRGVQQVELQVAARNPDGRRFWEAVGAEPVMIRLRIDLEAGERPRRVRRISVRREESG